VKTKKVAYGLKKKPVNVQKRKHVNVPKNRRVFSRSITRNERPHRQFAVEPAHPRLRVHAAVVRNIRYLRVAFFVER